MFSRNFYSISPDRCQEVYLSLKTYLKAAKIIEPSHLQKYQQARIQVNSDPNVNASKKYYQVYPDQFCCIL